MSTLSPLSPSRTSRQAGFTLLELSMVLAIIALVTAMGMSMGKSMIESAERVSTNNKLDAIEAALTAYRMTYNRLPCPADATLAAGNANYGVEAANAGSCTGGTPAANSYDSTNRVAEGAVPFKTLSLPEEFMYDAWGRKFAYAAWTRQTEASSFVNYGIAPNCGKIIVKNAAGDNRTAKGIYAVMSYGQNGHGGYLKSGARHNANSANTGEQANCHCGVNAADTGYASTYIQKEATQNPADSLDVFDDIVRYRERWQLQNAADGFNPSGASDCVPGFRIDGNSSLSGVLVAGVGDVNGDGIPDLVIEYGAWDWRGSYVYVIFGAATGWPVPPTGFDPTTQLNGTNGFTIALNDGTTALETTVGDINGDGYSDIVISGLGKNFVIFGGIGAWPATVNVTSLNGYTGTNGTSGVTINGTGICCGIFGPAMTDAFRIYGKHEIIDVDGDGYKDLVFAGGMLRGTWHGNAADIGGFVIYGKPNTGGAGNNDWQHTATIDATTLDGTNGFQFYSSDSTVYGWGVFKGNLSGDLDNDGYDDMLLDAYKAGYGPAVAEGSAYLVYGRPRADWTSAFTTLNGNNAVVDIKAEIVANRVSQFYGPQFCCNETSVTDANGDGIKDLIFGDYYTPVIVLYGGSRWPATYDINNPPIVTEGFKVSGSGAPGWINEWWGLPAMADVNGDGKLDLILVTPSAGPLGRAWGTGAVLVFLQPNTGWPASVAYSDFHWDGTDSFQIYGPGGANNNYCYFANVADVRPGDSNKPEIIVSCFVYGKNAYGSIYGLFGKTTWPAVVDLNDLN